MGRIKSLTSRRIDPVGVCKRMFEINDAIARKGLRDGDKTVTFLTDMAGGIIANICEAPNAPYLLYGLEGVYELGKLSGMYNAIWHNVQHDEKYKGLAEEMLELTNKLFFRVGEKAGWKTF